MTDTPSSSALLTECDREPINFPGAVQAHGGLLALDSGSLRVTHASANLDTFLGVAANAALGRAASSLLGDEIAALVPGMAQTRRANPSAVGLDAGLANGRVRLLPFVTNNAAICIDLFFEPPPDPTEPALLQAQNVIQTLRLSRTSEGLCRIVVNDVRRITGFDRVMVYRFDEDGSGDIIAENHASGVTSFLGLKYPASDIPVQARRLYMLQRVRVIPDVRAAPVALLALPGSHATDIDLSASWFRAVSPAHLQYLQNMAVGATAVVSLIVAGRLWGMLVCHHNSPRQINAHQRALLDLVGQVMSVMLGSLIESERTANQAQRRQALAGIAAAVGKNDNSMADAFAASAADLLNLVPAQGAVVTVGDRAIPVGNTPGAEAFQAIRASMSTPGSESLTATASLSDFSISSDLEGFAGALLLPLPNCAEGGSIIWFRRELNLTVNWAGNPQKLTPDPVSGKLEPRQSFATWQQEVRGRAAPWTDVDLIAARELRRIVDEALVRRHEGELLVRLRDNDSLTGLLNRHAVENHLSVVAALPIPPETALAIINVDRFRNVNELLGHRAGDALLVQVAHRLRLIVKPAELVARMGPNEFAILSDTGLASDLAARLTDVFSQPFQIAKQVLHIHGSVGVADNSPGGSAVVGLLHSAETAMRQAKLAGDGRVSIFARAVRDEASRELIVEQSLGAALRTGREQFQLAFQPIVDVGTGALRSWEVLLRWQHPILGNVAPGVFIPIAESCGLIAAIGDLVLEASFRHLVEAPPSIELRDQEAYISVNVSPLQLARKNFAREIGNQLDASGINPRRLCIEVTEGVFTNAEAVATISEIRRLGVLVAVDDFGVGYSSLSTLQRLPADVVKLDRTFLPTENELLTAGRSFLSAVVALAHTVGLQVVIEGVENQMQLNAAVLADVDAIQGYFFDRPMTSEAAMAIACQANEERTWKGKLETAERFAAGACLTIPDASRRRAASGRAE